MEELKTGAAIVVTITVLSLAVVGAGMLGTATKDSFVISNCESQGWHNFGQTRIVCMVEPKKEVK